MGILRLITIPLIFSGLVPAGGLPPAKAARSVDQAPRVVEIIAGSDDVFHVPGEKDPIIQAKPGEALTLHITAQRGAMVGHDGAVHGLVIDQFQEQGWDLRLYEGTHDYQVTAPRQAGEYDIECTVLCGPGHASMKMKLIVRQ